ncbi:MAG: formyltetrahydrofolate deformylase [Nitrososphaera sp.]|uniref:Formyltetrahydrofolate deformylase n=1 Tax=Nitrososphaera gargensis (strain Ga9.2) TaxID=1237085 RepID=K0IKX3_NITGG|nr:formyltetrahydrofolate deformylase [Candidatus Nitrososphaera gargensis]AFU59197.1 formyltetrahydrofolate deformylase [Candidatus Nitrososphaera gargensis Ga9.2]
MAAARGKTIIEVTVVGPDRKGVVADITNFIFRNGGNIEKINQNVVRGLFGMQLEASFAEIDRKQLDDGLKQLSKKLSMEIKVHYQEPDRLQNVAIFVSKEPHCLAKLLEAKKKGEIKANIPVVIGSDTTLKPMADEVGIPFHAVAHIDQAEAENKILQLIDQYNIDLIVLARYMRILTPNFVWRYPNRIINIHPSLLPAFPGAYAYVQAYERGAKIVGCTAHFVTEDLDQGPIISQESFKVSKGDTLDTIKKKGQEMEAATLLEAVRLYLENKLEVYWGKVYVKDDERTKK